MEKKLVQVMVLVAMPLALLAACRPIMGATSAANQSPRGPAGAQALLETLPLYFIENHGQADPRVAYYLKGGGTSVYFAPDGVTFALGKASDDRGSLDRSMHGARNGEPETRAERWAVKLEFQDANPEVEPVGQQRTEAVVSYFKGPPGEWQAGLPTYAEVVYRELWPGIDLVYSGTAGRLKYTFLVKPGADPAQISLAYRGATEVRLNEAGQVEVSTPAGGFRDDRPYAYQDVDGQRLEVAAEYALGPEGFGFGVGPYDPTRPLVLDPVMLAYAGYIGGVSTDEGWHIAVDRQGNAYIAGFTDSSETTFPAQVGPALTYNTNRDAFVAKVDPSGTALVYAGYIGGDESDDAFGIAVDNRGNAYVVGRTMSSEATFPATVGPDTTYNGNGDAFVAKVNRAGTGLDYAGYIGGTSSDEGFGVAVDRGGNAYVAGRTYSDETTDGFPVAVGPDLTHNGDLDAFVAKVDQAGTALAYAGYIGGANGDGAYAIALDGGRNAYVTGFTQSPDTSFPVTVGPDLTLGGFQDGSVAKVDPAGTGLVYAGYIGGDDNDSADDIAVSGRNAYVTGWTTSDQTTFPVKVGPDTSYNGGSGDAFVAKIDRAGTGFVYAGYIGGAYEDYGIGIAVDTTGNAYVTGSSSSDETTFPVAVGPDLSHNGNYDAFVVKVDSSGTWLVYAGYIGGGDTDWGFGIAVLGNHAYVAGRADSPEATFPETVGPDLTHNGGADAFVAKIEETPGTPARLGLKSPASERPQRGEQVPR